MGKYDQEFTILLFRKNRNFLFYFSQTIPYLLSCLVLGCTCGELEHTTGKFESAQFPILIWQFTLGKQLKETLINCLAYIDLNPLRAGIVGRPEDYRWNSLGYHVQTNNRDDFLSTDFGLKELNPPPADKCLKSKKERIRRYHRYVYEAGAVNRPEKGKSRGIGDRILEKERNREFELSRSDRFRYRTRYFTDSGISGSKEFVYSNYQRFKHLFYSKHEKKPRPIKGL